MAGMAAAHLWRRVFRGLALLWLVCSLAAPAAAVPPDTSGDEVIHVLLLNSYHPDMSWVQQLVRGVEEEMLPEERNISLHIEYMDTKRIFSEDYLEALAGLYRLKYRRVPLRLIISSDNHAYDFLRARRDALFPGVPVVFCGVNDFQQEQLAGLRGFTGIEEVFSAAETLELALRLHPGTTEVLVINDFLKTGRAWERTIRREVRPLEKWIRFRYAENVDVEELRRRIRTLAPGTIILLGVYFADQHGHYLTYEQIGARIAEGSPVPVYCLLDFNVGRGVVGGKVISGYHQGKMAATLGRRILAGEDPERMPVMRTGVNRYIFDHMQLERFGIDEDRLPPGSIVVNRPFSAYREHRPLIWTVAVFILALLAAIAALANNIRKRRIAQRKLKAIFDQTFQFIGLLDLDGTVLNINASALEFCGIGAAEVIGRPFWETAWWRHSPELQARLRQAIKGAAAGNFQRYEITLPALDGSQHTFDFSLKPATDKEGRTIFLLPEGRDISEHKRTEKALEKALARTKESRDRIDAILTSVADGLVVVDSWGKITLMNPAAEGFLGQRLSEVRGQPLDEVIRELAGGKSSPTSLLEGDTLAPVELELPDRHNQLCQVEATKTVLQERAGAKAGFIIALRDITRERELEQMKNEFLSTAAHELRTPLAVIRGFAELLLGEEEFTAEQKGEFLGTIYRKTEVLEEIIDGLLDLSRAASGRLIHIERVPCELGAVVAAVVAQHQADFPDHRFDLNLPPRSLPVMADTLKITQVLENLLGNAVKFSSGSGRIGISGALSDGEVEIAISDEGIGMTAVQTARVFERFYKVDASATAKGGMGMGMALARNIVEAHGGRIWVESTPGKGTTVTFTLPFGRGG